jgi:YesN/AraC family two-component response regulator
MPHTVIEYHNRKGRARKRYEHLRKLPEVRENYADSNLDLSQIAQSVKMSPQYVSKLYKLETGQGLLDFINAVRICRAKEIMAEEQISLNDLALRVGYTNARTFRRAFQKIEGINPGSYKS